MARSVRAKRFAQFASLALAAGEISAVAAEVLVLSSGGPRASRHYKPGSRHADNTIFDLRPSDTLVVLAAGGTRSWRGPGYFSLVAPARPLILPNGQRARVQTAAVRSPPRQEGVQPTDFWHYDIRQEGHLCVASGARPLLWRPRSPAPARVTLTAANGASHSFEWPANQIVMAWPEAVPVRDNGRYYLAGTGLEQPVRITAHLVPAAGGRMADIAVQFVNRGCKAQLETLVATRADPTAPALEPTAGTSGSSR
jgi:hypothetical protein